MEQINQPGIPESEKRKSAKREKELNLSGLIYFNNRHASIKLIDERQGGIGIEMYTKIKDRMELQVGSVVEITTIINNQEVKVNLKVVNIREDKNGKVKIGLEYMPDSITLTLNSNRFRVGV